MSQVINNRNKIRTSVCKSIQIPYTVQKMKFSIKETADLVTFTEEILNGKLHFCEVFHICPFIPRKKI